jgi:hypothetical protein
MFGDAADVKDAGVPRGQLMSQSVWNTLFTDAGNAHADYIEPQSVSTLDHVHADWRSH